MATKKAQQQKVQDEETVETPEPVQTKEESVGERRRREAQEERERRRQEVLSQYRGTTRSDLRRLRVRGTLVFRRPKKDAEPVLVDYRPDR